MNTLVQTLRNYCSLSRDSHKSDTDYVEQIVVTLSRQLKAEFGGRFGAMSPGRMIQFVRVFPDKAIVVSLIRQLSWTHFLALPPLKEPMRRAFHTSAEGSSPTQAARSRSGLNGARRESANRLPNE